MIYLDNSATTFFKPKSVLDSFADFMKKYAANPGRSGHSLSIDAMRVVVEVREKIADFFGIINPMKVAFTSNATVALNIAIRGFLKSGDHVLVSKLEHNSVMRPLNDLKDINYDRLISDENGLILWDQLEAQLKENTKALIINHASNVSGIIQNLDKVKELKEKHNLILIVDASQSAGLEKIDMTKMGIDILCFTGHKYLFGLQGVGGIVLGDDFDEERLDYLYSGGSGSKSEAELHPEFIPDKFEAGTVNTFGIYALGKALDYLETITLEEIIAKEREINKNFIEKCLNIPKIDFYGIRESQGRTATFSLNIRGLDPAKLTYLLDRDYQIMTRPGLHCAPIAHKTLGSFPKGTVRFSFAYNNTMEELNKTIEALYCLSKCF